MKSILRKTGNAVISGVCSTLGAVHFIAQTSADVVMHAEAKIQHRRYGVQVEDSKNERMLKTVTRQIHIAEKVEAFKDAVTMAKKRASEEYDVAMNNIVLVNAEQVITQ